MSEEADRFYNLNDTLSFILGLFRFKKQPYIVSSIFLFLYLLRILPRYDIIYARDYHTVMIALFPRLIFKKKLVFEINGIAHEEQRLKSNSIINRILVFLIQEAEKMATKYSERIVSVTPQISAYMIQNYHCSQEKVKIIPNGVDTKKFYPIYDEALLGQWKERLGILKEEIVIAFVGNMAPWQGVDTLIESALRLLLKKRGLIFLIVGEGRLKDALIHKVANSGFAESFVFTGMVNHNDIPFLVNIADICVAPIVSKRNKMTFTGSPIKVYEYIACGKPVISSKFEGLEFIEHEGVGRLTEPGDVTDLEEALENLVNDPQMRADMGQKGAQIAQQKYDWAWSVKKIEEILKDMV